MAAVLKQVVSSRDELVGRGNDLMATWALYRRDASRSPLPHIDKMPWSERLDKATDGEPEWVILIDRMIADLGRINDFYPRLIKRFYLDHQAVWQVAEKLCRTEGFVMLCLRGVCELAEHRIPE
jgi:hypothetical protein